jgi:hypothetical protein
LPLGLKSGRLRFESREKGSEIGGSHPFSAQHSAFQGIRLES